MHIKLSLTICAITSLLVSCKQDNLSWIAKLPKVETHVHLDGSVRMETIWDIMQQDSIDLGVTSVGELKKICQVIRPMKSLDQVLDVFWVHQKVLNSYENIKRITFENVEDAYNDGVKLLELRFAPTFISAYKTDLTNDDIVKGVLDGIMEGMKSYDIEVGLIAIGVRGMPLDENMKALLTILKYKNSHHPLANRLVGYDLAAGELGINFEDYIPLIKTAKDGGLHITVHSGEETNSEYIRKTLSLLKAERIGHGIKAWDDKILIAELIEKNIHLELSVTSNWLTKAVPSLDEHPIKEIYEAGVSISINTDDPHLMNINLIHEYELLVKQFGFTRDDFMKINRDALAHSFLPDSIINAVRKKYFEDISN